MNRKVTGKASTMAGGLAVGATVSVGITIILAVVAAKLIDSSIIQESSVGYVALGILLLSSVLGAAAAWGRIKRQRLLVCMAAGGIYYALLLCMTALFFSGQYQGMGVTALAVLGGCGAVALAGMGQGRRKHPYRQRVARS